jgi:hypothetical protein
MAEALLMAASFCGSFDQRILDRRQIEVPLVPDGEKRNFSLEAKCVNFSDR